MVAALEGTAEVPLELGLGDAGLLEVQHVEEVPGVELVEHVDHRDAHGRHVRHAESRDGSNLVGVEERGAPHDRRAPVVADEHDRPVVEGRGHRGDVAGKLAERVPLDLRRHGAAAVAAHVQCRDPVPSLGQVGDLVAPRRGQLGPTRNAEDRRTAPGDLHPQRDLAVLDQQLVRHRTLHVLPICLGTIEDRQTVTVDAEWGGRKVIAPEAIATARANWRFGALGWSAWR